MLAGLKNRFMSLVGPVDGWSAAVRDYEVSIVPLSRLDGTQVGLFVAEMYELAKGGQLKDQMQFERWKRDFIAQQTTNNDGQVPSQEEILKALNNEKPDLANVLLVGGEFELKTPFELAVLPVMLKDGARFVPDGIRAEISREFHARIKAGLPLQHSVSKLTVASSYLPDIKSAGLKVTEGYSPCMHVTLNFSNPVAMQPKVERLMHYTATWLALMMTGIAVATVGAFGMPGLLAVAAATFLVARSGNNFGLFDNVETLLHEVPTYLSKDFKWFENVTLKKAIEFTLKSAAILTISTLAAVAVSQAVMSLALPLAASAAMPAMLLKAVSVLQVGAATVAGGVAFISAFFGSRGPLKKERGLSPNDKRIHIPAVVAERLPAAKKLSNSKKLRDGVDKLFETLDTRAANERVNIDHCTMNAKLYIINRLEKGKKVRTSLQKAEEKGLCPPRFAH
jgi:hypothetical protein